MGQNGRLKLLIVTDWTIFVGVNSIPSLLHQLNMGVDFRSKKLAVLEIHSLYVE
jgi:hypothetical protein